jgi:UDP-N-acetylmuramate dehydrogenase
MELKVRGRLEKDRLMANCTWLRVGGKIEWFFHPADEEDLSCFLSQTKGLPKFVVGAGSNILVRDGGITGIGIKLGKGFHQFQMEGLHVDLGAGLLDRHVAQRCQQEGLSGFEFLYTIPGTIGGGLAMNAGCYGGEVADRLVWARMMDPLGAIHTLSHKELNYSYRRCHLPQGWIFLGGRFKGIQAHPHDIAHTMKEFLDKREDTQPLHVRTGGSTFANPTGYKAWELIDRVGYRGKIKGGAQFSSKHCNFLINRGDSTAADLEDLGEEVREKVKQELGICLEWEIVRWGNRENITF